MIEVIKHGKTKFRAVCSNCGCEFTYELCDIKALGGIDCPDCGHYVAPERPYWISTESKPEDNKAELTTTNTDKSKVVGSLYGTQGDVYTTEKDLEIQQIFKDQMSRKMAIPCADYTQDQLKNLQEQLEKDAYHWVSQSTII